MATPLHGRIDSAIRTAKQWESDKSLLKEIRESIPMELLVPELVCEREAEWRSFLNDDDTATAAAPAVTKSPYYRDDDVNYEGDDLLLKRLTLYFKAEVMKWCNQPPCCNSTCTGNDDGKQMESKGMRGPITQEEKSGGASRVEVYNCTLCNTETVFPRYNSPRALLSSKRGRCGEFANLFGTYCRALGFDTRYVLDFTDHVWVEVWSVRQQRWLHADSCEGLIDRPNMYEQGWGKKLNYAVAATHDSVADVSKRYTRKFLSDEFQTRRREFSPNEVMSDQVFMQMNGTVRQMSKVAKGRAEELDKRAKMEEKFFNTVQSSGVWDSEYREGRISGSLAWKAARRELGGEDNDTSKTDEKKDGDDKASAGETSFWVESFLPSPRRQNDMTIAVRPKATEGKSWSIQVNGVPCAATLSNGVAVVIVDELTGCILQSKAFVAWSSVASFLDTVPDGRIVALCSIADDEEEEKKESTNKINFSDSSKFGRLGGFDYDKVTSSPKDFVSFIGRLAFHPTWSSFHVSSESSSMEVSIQFDKPTASTAYKLRSEKNTVPAVVYSRLPDYIMPLNTQLLASNYQKRVAFEAYMEKDSMSSSIVGYTTRSDAPVYLIQNSGFPFRTANGPTQANAESDDSSWTTYHYLPDAIVPDDDVVEEQNNSKNSGTPNFDIPIADDYFMGLLGSQLLVKNGNSSTPTLLDTPNALTNSRLIALYFSASWCGPCRGFTPMLIEFHNVLKEEVASSHGLEIVFVSSDRSDAEFQQYYKKMPSFKAMPFSQRELAQRAKSLFGVRGIPSLVIIDSLSGRIVVSPDESRREVHQACQYGEKAIERLFHSWLDKVPEESKSMLDILALSCAEADETAKTGGGNTKAETYLKRAIEKEATVSSPLSKDDIAARVKELFPQLVAQGLAPNEAAAEAIKQATLQQSDSKLDSGHMGGESKIVTHYDPPVKTDMSVATTADNIYRMNSDDKDKVVAVLSTAQKYVANVQKDPTNPRFRNFRLSNKVFDKITSNAGSMELLKSLNFSVFHSDIDFVASIPLSVDLELLGKVLDKVLATYQHR
uniref:Thioredoxin domain-containing protein n=1 Tax=Skeletonema marinoi TaxID=267567 RepID=A0A7S2L2R3_9STRA|mmetsp:Transcript_20110/g.34059  ORF Transcript_20110/g.34059 Transcript_20110/m.34059 type:complete len:1057 (+) Transcript_20110:104-3274(+)